MPLSASGGKPTEGTWDWLKTAVYMGPSLYSGTKLDMWAANLNVSYTVS